MLRALAFFLSLPLLAQPAPDFTSIEKSAREELASLHVPGASIAIVRGNEVIYAKAFGMADVESGERVRPEMLFRLGSTTKMLTATALVSLSLEGKLDLNAPIGKYLPTLPPKLSQVTANQLLSHTSGIRDEAPMYGSHDDSALGNGIRSWTDDWLFTAPGRIFSYSNPGYWMAGYLVESLSGKPYADAMEERVFRPCSMTHTTLRPTTAMTWPLAQGHQESAGVLTVARPAADNAGSWPAGSVFSNTADLARFVTAFLNDGLVDGKRALDPKVISILSTTHSRYPESADTYGYGLEIRELRGVHVVEHSGSRMGYGSHIRMAPEQRVGIIILTNRTGAELPATLEKASELMLPLQAKVARAAREITADERHVGVYRNGAERLEVVSENGQLKLKRGGAPSAPLRNVVLVPGADGRTEYVFSGSRAFARVQ
ncbi:MAG TPA: serine hydrolase domain-containing protein [Bryobacteraceae bacterium]|nr:serine hydrolase domain-containing protein [Bryobacteraceae bacterium]